jgi:hypothetical protein
MAKLTRREFLAKSAKVGGFVMASSVAPAFLKHTFAEEKYAEYLKAKINWRQVEGETIKVLVTRRIISTKYELSPLSSRN